MLLARVLGYATATIKDQSLRGQKLLVVQPLLMDGRSPDGDPLLAVDTVGAGAGETVVVTSDGKFVREWVKSDACPARWSIIGIRDARSSDHEG